MTTQDRIKDIFSTGNFNIDEIEHIKDNEFKTWEFYLILHLTNAELYHTEEELINTHADLIEDTPKGRIYCFS